MFDLELFRFIGEEFPVCLHLALGAVEVFFPGGAFRARKLVDTFERERKRRRIGADDCGLRQERPEAQQKKRE